MNGNRNCDLHNCVAVNSALVPVTDVMSITVLTKVIMKKIAVMGLSVENMIGMMNLMDWLVVKICCPGFIIAWSWCVIVG